jgi:hypothetical protein
MWWVEFWGNKSNKIPQTPAVTGMHTSVFSFNYMGIQKQVFFVFLPTIN